MTLQINLKTSSTKKLFTFILLVVLALSVFAGSASAADEWLASYWNNMELSGPPDRQRIEAQAPDVGFGRGSPIEGINADQWSARWTSNPYFEAGRYRFSLRSDDGARLWVNNQLIIDEWHDSTGETYTSEIDFSAAGEIPIRLDFYEDRGNAGIHLTWERVGAPAGTAPIKAEYFNNMILEGTPALIRNEGPGLYHNWGNGSPAPGIINNDRFSARYTQAMNLAAGRYRFTASADDGLLFWINGQLLIDKWNDSTSQPTVVEADLPGGIVNFTVHYYENVGEASISLTVARVGGPGSDEGDDVAPPEGITGTVNTAALNLRSGPGTEFAPIDVLFMGDTVTLTGLNESYWVEVQTADNVIGWVSARYLDYRLPAGVVPAG